MTMDNVVTTPANPLKPSETKLVELHKMLTENWRQNSLCKGPLISKIPLACNDFLSTNALRSREDSDLDSEFGKLLQDGDVDLFPLELLQNNNMESTSSDMKIQKGKNQRLHAKLKTIEMKEQHDQEQNSDIDSARKKDRMELDHHLFNDNDDALVGDYCYTFCEEEQEIEDEQ